MKPVDVNLSTYIDFNKENNKEDPKFEVSDHVRISKDKNITQKVTFQISLIIENVTRIKSQMAINVSVSVI